MALAEGWLVHRGRETCAFSHDRCRQAAVAFTEQMPADVVMSMNLKIALVLLQQANPDYFRLADFAKRSIPMLPDHPKRSAFFDVFLRASVVMRHSKGRMKWHSNIVNDGLTKTLHGLRALGVELKEHVSEEQINAIYERVRSQILETGFDQILALPHCSDPKVELMVSLLNDTSINAHWAQGQGLTDVNIELSLKHGISTGSPGGFMWALGVAAERKAHFRFGQQMGKLAMQLAAKHSVIGDRAKYEVMYITLASGWETEHIRANLARTESALRLSRAAGDRHGISTGSPGGFMWALGVAAERKAHFRFGQQMGKLAMQLAAKHSVIGDRAKYEVMYITLASGWETEHIRANLARTESALRLSRAAGDRIYASLASLFNVQTQLFTYRYLSELVTSCEDAYQDVTTWISGNNTEILVMAILMCARAFGGYTVNTKLEDALDCEEFIESEYLENVVMQSANVPFVLNWYNTFKVVALYSLGYWSRAAELGFQIYESRKWHPNYRHRDTWSKSEAIRSTSESGLKHQSPKNTMHWLALMDAEFASLTEGADALKLYDIAIKIASDNDWILEEGWALLALISSDVPGELWERNAASWNRSTKPMGRAWHCHLDGEILREVGFNIHEGRDGGRGHSDGTD
ncbi:hypothetical protein DACRYDRAFT_116815 [Dacryopinax primogenitus]|uniref:Uncharacterized protein n=1 Tax=Dacryopinax primogenitus (strain DJM 731) TaxID=1858805 RepID=M5FTI9_DACPD|nr:uncharacterized protein DACRYDRAFT_116815 [Dacryopinax primogenitus]EJU00961.1 hypothetical protein DACRYDRAFT_116815 [Dacryopinax primogenitus]